MLSNITRFAVLLMLLTGSANGQPARWEISRKLGGALGHPAVLDSSRLAIAGYDGSDRGEFYITLSEDAGATWRDVFVEARPSFVRDPALYLLIAYPAPGVLYAASKDSNRILRSDNGGETWQVSVLANRARIQNLSMLDARRGVVSIYGSPTPPSYVYATDDGWATWREVHLPKAVTDTFTLGQALNVGPSAYICLMNRNDRQVVCRSSDGGATWSVEAPFARRHNIIKMAFLDARNGWAVGARRTSSNLRSSAAVYRTTDAGHNWVMQLDTPDTWPLSSVAFADSLNGYVAGSMRVSRTSDGGATWQREAVTEEIGTDVLYIAYGDRMRGLLFTQSGFQLERGVLAAVDERREIGAVAQRGIVVERGSDVQLVVPAGASLVRVIIADALGRNVAEYSAEEVSAGPVTIPTGVLPRGLYFGTMDSGASLTRLSVLIY